MSNHERARTPLANSQTNTPGLYTASLFDHAQKKRKRGSLDSSRASGWFDAKVISPSDSRKDCPISFLPITTVLRAHIPLSWLSGDSSFERLTPGTIFRADVSSVARWDYSVLIARQVPNGAMYTIEQIEPGTYICFPLRDCVTVDWVKQASIGAAPLVNLDCILQAGANQWHRRTPSISSNVGIQENTNEAHSPKQPQNRRGILARKSIMAKQAHPTMAEGHSTFIDSNNTQMTVGLPHTECVDEDTKQDPELTTQSHNDSTADSDDAAMVNTTKQAETPDMLDVAKHMEDKSLQVDQLSPEYLRKRYLEMLYLSKTSLAFYAKGPLSRTRARARAPGASMTLHTLAMFYRDSILPVKKLDLKYRESLKSKIMSLAPSQNENEAVREMPAHLQTSKKSKRTKLGKDALWPVEDEFVQRWWRDRELGGESAVTPAALTVELERKLPALRMRETELQVILILEVLALESQETQTVPGLSDGKHDVKLESIENNPRQPVPANPTTKKTRDLKADLDVLLDKLCILHSVGFEDLSTIPTEDNDEKQLASGVTKDDLKEFCKEVVIPFYSTKLPDECKSVCKKLGGIGLSPQRLKPGENRLVSNLSPGSAVPGRARTSSKASLTRVLSEQHSLRNGSPPVLIRSYTLPPSANLKREASERPKSRGGVQKSLSFTNREIDLVADAQATAVKRRKLDRIVAQKRELEAAIDALKRPNRLVAAKTFMDDAERRITEDRMPNKKNEPVQIIATPKIARTKPILVDEYDLPPMATDAAKPEDAFVPSSTVKPRGLSHISNMARSSAKKNAILSAIHDTPLRQYHPKLPNGNSETGNDSGANSEAVNQSSSTLVDSTPATSRLRPDLVQTVFSTPTQATKHPAAYLFTPVRRPQISIEDAFKDAPEIPERANRMMDRVMMGQESGAEVSIYDSLGWTNDDYDI